MDKLKNNFIGFLRWSERYTKTDMVYLFKGGSWLTAGQILTAGAVFLTSIAFANILSQETYGLYKYVISVFGLLAITTLSGLNTAIVQAVARGLEGDIKKILRTKIIWGLGGSILGFLLASYYYLQDNNILALAFVIAAIFIPFLNPLSIYGSYLQGKKNFRAYSIYNTLSKIFEAAAIITALFLTRNIFILLLVFFGANTILNGIFSLFTFAREKLNDTRDKETLRYGKHLSALNVVNFIAGQIDKVLIFQFVGAVELAIYTFAIAPLDQLKGLFKNINFMAWPKFAQAPLESRKFLFGKMKRLAAAVIFISLVYALAAPLLYKFIFPQYLASVPLSQLLALSLFAAVLMEFGGGFMEAQGIKKAYYKYSVGLNIFNLLILFPLVYFGGLWGAVSARILTRLVGLGLSVIFIKNIKQVAS